MEQGEGSKMDIKKQAFSVTTRTLYGKGGVQPTKWSQVGSDFVEDARELNRAWKEVPAINRGAIGNVIMILAGLGIIFYYAATHSF